MSSLLLDDVVRLIGIRSTADRPDELRRALDFMLDLVGPGFSVRRFSSGGKPSALVTVGPGLPRVILNAHLDVVPGSDAQFAARLDGDRLYGRGAHDMKAAAVVLATVFRDCARTLPYPIALQLVTDEEVGGFDGTGHQVAQGVRGEFVVIGEQSGLRIVTESKGIVRVRLEAVGVSAHAAYPWLGSNALDAVVSAVSALTARYPVPEAEVWTTTVNVASVATSNVAANIVPADATALLDIRFPPSDPDLAGRSPSEIVSFLASVTGPAVEVTVEALGAPHHASSSSAFVGLLGAAARSVGYEGSLLRKHGAADGRFYSAQGVDAVIFGPGGDGQHGPEEYLDVRTLDPYQEALIAFLKSAGE
ncbi:succinyl-diaminopimelate desuccinylase [Actinoplanes lutulentus]|uniref:Succinyl-diaminopimelate desuccinylase n=1 Tax=Actinoplanes lutulentus TaxID=1287878 RepID=A0A327ZC34_9ACTN|nr:M20/M25/M40 family metallo-hydrolase [Actinoplanes lutulentus]MBB2946757.1 succinyl-diaminopimelate desuccinylase [Actinoplanes lutulentus]RAK35649.1 succinyl-diaminopimelate desuccinylase [Actinoplanes lutulentus]